MLHTGSGSRVLVADRDETKFLIQDGAGERMAAVLNDQLPPISPPGGALITSVYFDTPTREILSAARSGQRSVKVRVKEYETSTDPEEVWLELKLREGQRTGKLREPAHRGRVLGAIQAAPAGDGPLIDALGRLAAALTGPLQPACTVSYRRMAWETPDERIRVTIDTAIRYAPAPPVPWGHAPLSTSLPPAVGEFEGGILELKLRVPAPAWLTQLVERLSLASSPFSKFVGGSEALSSAAPSVNRA